MEQRCKVLAKFSNTASEVGGPRPLGGCALSPCGERAAIADWSGGCGVWRIATCQRERAWAAHAERANAVLFHREARAADSSAVELMTASVDESVKLWAASGSAIAQLQGHSHRVNRLALHREGRLLASTSHDETWRLWDLETQKELYMQVSIFLCWVSQC